MRTVELLLTDNIDNLGIVGDVVRVKTGYARNYLLPRGLAGQPTPGNIKRLAARRAQVEQEMREHRATQEVLLTKLEGYELTLQRSANEQGVLFGGVSQHDIAQALSEEGFAIEDRMVRIGQQIKRLDTYEIPLVLAADLKTQIKLWVVSDKPAEELGESTEEAPAGEEGAEETAISQEAGESA